MDAGEVAPARVVEQRADPTELLDCVAHRGVERVEVGDVRLVGDAVDLTGDHLGTVAVDVEHRDPSALGCHALAGGAPNPRGASGDDGPLTVEESHGRASYDLTGSSLPRRPVRGRP